MSQKIIYSLVCAGVLLLFSTKVFAQTASDVVCTGCVGSTDIATNGVAAANIATNAVTAAKIQSNAVTTAKILDGTIANADISLTAAISPSKISGTAWTSTNDGSSSGLDPGNLDGLTSGQFLRSDQGGTFAGDLAVTGNISLTGNITSSGDICIGQCP